MTTPGYESLVLKFEVDATGAVVMQKVAAQTKTVGAAFNAASQKVGLFKRSLDAINRATGAVTGSIGRIVRAMTSLRGIFLSTAAVYATSNLVRTYAEFEQQIVRIGTLTMGTDAEIQAMGRSIRDLSYEFGAMPLDTAHAFYETISAGYFEGAEAATIMHEANRLAIAGVASVEEAAEALIATLKPYSLGVEDAAEVSDILFSTMRDGIVTIPELADALSSVTAATAEGGVSIRELMASISAVTAVSKSTVGEVATQITSVIKSSTIVADRMAEINAKFAGSGIKFDFTPASIRAKGLVQTLVELRQELEKIGDVNLQKAVLADLIPRVEGQRFFAYITGPALDEFKKVFERDVTGYVQQALDKMVDTGQFAINRLANSFYQLRVAIGAIVFSVLKDDLVSVSETFYKLAAFLDANADQVSAAVSAVYQTIKDIVWFVYMTIKGVYNIAAQIVAEMSELFGGIYAAFVLVEGVGAKFGMAWSVVRDALTDTSTILGSIGNALLNVVELLIQSLLVPVRAVIAFLSGYLYDQLSITFYRLYKLFVELIQKAGKLGPVKFLLGDVYFQSIAAEVEALTGTIAEMQANATRDFIGDVTSEWRESFAATITSAKQLYDILAETAALDLSKAVNPAIRALIAAWQDFQASAYTPPDPGAATGRAGRTAGLDITKTEAEIAAYEKASDAMSRGLSEQIAKENDRGWLLDQNLDKERQAFTYNQRQLDVLNREFDRREASLGLMDDGVEKLKQMELLSVERANAEKEATQAAKEMVAALEEQANASSVAAARRLYAGTPLGNTMGALQDTADLINEQDVLQAKFADALKNGLITQQEYHEAHAKAVLSIYGSLFASLSTALNDYVAATGESSEEIAYVQKGLAIAQATIATYLAATQALASSAVLGPEAAIAAAVLIAAVGLANVALIAATPITYHTGGLVQRDYGGGSEVNATLQTGEYVVSRAGVAYLDSINRGQRPESERQPARQSVDRVVVMDSRDLAEAIRYDTAVRVAVRSASS